MQSSPFLSYLVRDRPRCFPQYPVLEQTQTMLRRYKLYVKYSGHYTVCWRTGCASLQTLYCRSRLVLKYSRTRVQRHRCVRHLAYRVRYYVVPVIYPLLTITSHPSVITTQNIQSLPRRYNRVRLHFASAMTAAQSHDRRQICLFIFCALGLAVSSVINIFVP
jgi:hypothetical protein